MKDEYLDRLTELDQVQVVTVYVGIYKRHMGGYFSCLIAENQPDDFICVFPAKMIYHNTPKLNN